MMLKRARGDWLPLSPVPPGGGVVVERYSLIGQRAFGVIHRACEGREGVCIAVSFVP